MSVTPSARRAASPPGPLPDRPQARDRVALAVIAISVAYGLLTFLLPHPHVDLAALSIPADRTYASPAAIGALLDGIAGTPRAAAIAAALLDQVVATDPGAAAHAATARLRSVAGG